MVYNHNTVGENGDFQPLQPKISRNSQTLSNRPRLILTINCKFAVDFFARGLHTRTAVARLPSRQLGFLVLESGRRPIDPGLLVVEIGYFLAFPSGHQCYFRE